MLMMQPGIRNGDTRRGPLFLQGVRVFADRHEAADAGTDRDTDTVSVFFRHHETAVLERLGTGHSAVQHELIEAAGFLRGNVGARIEITDFTRDLAGVLRSIKTLNLPDTGLTGKRVLPGFFNAVTKGAHNAKPRHDHTTHNDKLQKFNAKKRETRLVPGFPFLRPAASPDSLSAGVPDRKRKAKSQRTSGLLMFLDVIDRLLDGAQLFLFAVRDLDAEGIFKGHHEFNGVKAVSAQIFDEGGLILDVGFIDAQLFSNNLLDTGFDIFFHLNLRDQIKNFCDVERFGTFLIDTRFHAGSIILIIAELYKTSGKNFQRG